MNEIVVIAGKAGSGKDSIARIIEKLDYEFVISTSTRPMRDGESEGNPYYFITNEQFENLISKNTLIEYRKYNTIEDGKDAVWYYGVSKSQIKDDKRYVVVLDPQGANDFKIVLQDRVKVFYIDVNTDERRRRAMSRGGYEEAEFNRRSEDDEKRFTKDVIESIADFTVQNYDLDECVKEILYKIKHPNVIGCSEMEGV